MSHANRAFDEMLQAAYARLGQRNPEIIAERSGISYDAFRCIFQFESLGQPIRVSYPEYFIEPEDIDPWHELVILHSMDLADGQPLSDQWIAMAQFKNGMVRGGGFDQLCEDIIRRQIGRHGASTIESACLRLGATIIESNADLCAAFSLLPRFPILLKIWFADDELPASGRMFFNACADHYLTVEDAVAAGTLLLDKLTALLGD